MSRNLAFAAILAVILAGMALAVWRVGADGNIYIRNDGSIDPPTAPITTSDNITYTLTADIISSVIVVERNNITVDGDGHTVGGAANGIRLSNISYVRIENTARASLAVNKVRGVRNVASYALYSLLCLVLNREAAENIRRSDKAVSPTYFNT
jgi:hypothetical protein